MQTLRITPLGPAMFRDPRPFGAGAGSASTLLYPTTQTIAGAVRAALVLSHVDTFLGTDNHLDTSKQRIVLDWRVGANVLSLENEWYFPVPADALVYPQPGVVGELRAHRAIPLDLKTNQGMNLPNPGLRPAGLRKIPQGKPFPNPPLFWSKQLHESWLCGKDIVLSMDGLDGVTPDVEQRVRIAINRDTGAADQGMLFTTERTVFLFAGKNRHMDAREGSFLVEIDAGDVKLEEPISIRFGGEGGFALVDPVENCPLTDMPEAVKSAIDASPRSLKMQLVTPAVLQNGWLPGWIDEQTLSGVPPDWPDTSNNTKLRLIAACVPRWKPLSGWDMVLGKPKPLWRVVPAGAVYFFEATGTSELGSIASHLWMRSICSEKYPLEKQARLDGAGLAVWGTWIGETVGNEL